MTVADNSYSLLQISIPRIQAEKVKETFYQYASSFNKKGDPLYNEHMEVKLKHTSQVCLEINSIGQSLGMSDEQLAFIEVIAWLHDIGRFEQFDIYGTFADAESENHSEIALRVIENKGILRSFNQQNKEVIFRSILNHNIPQVPVEEPGIIQFYSRILRDADKLDIWRISIEMNIFHKIKTESLPDIYEVPYFLLECFKLDKTIHLDQVQSFYDSILFRLSWIYDLNFTHSIEQVLERKIAEKLVAKIPQSASLEAISKRITRYMHQQIK
jgi:hypothetical protein